MGGLITNWCLYKLAEDRTGPRIAVLVSTQNLSLEEIFYTFDLTHIMMENTKVLQIWVNCSEPLHRFIYWTRLVLSLIIHELLTHIVSLYFIIENYYIFLSYKIK